MRVFVLLLLVFVTGALSQDFDLFHALDNSDPTPAKPKEQPKAPENPNDDGLDLFDALDNSDPTPAKPKEQPKAPEKPNDGEFNLEDAVGSDPDPKPDKPDKPVVHPPSTGGGGKQFDDSDLFGVGDGTYKPDGGRSGGGGGAADPGYDPRGGADQPQEAGTGQIAGIVSAVGVALLGAASSYFAYQKKKLCFKLQGGGGGADPEMGKGQHGRSDNQLFSNLLRTS